MECLPSMCKALSSLSSAKTNKYKQISALVMASYLDCPSSRENTGCSLLVEILNVQILELKLYCDVEAVIIKMKALLLLIYSFGFIEFCLSQDYEACPCQCEFWQGMAVLCISRCRGSHLLIGSLIYHSNIFISYS